MAATHKDSRARGDSCVLECGVAVLGLVEVELLLSGDAVLHFLMLGSKVSNRSTGLGHLYY